MKLSVIIITTLAVGSTTAAPAVATSLVERDSPINSTQSELHKRASWSITPFPGRDTCAGGASAITGSGCTRGCTNIDGSQVSSANIIISDTCTVTRWSGANCFEPLGSVGPGTSAWFTGQTIRSFIVNC